MSELLVGRSDCSREELFSPLQLPIRTEFQNSRARKVIKHSKHEPDIENRLHRRRQNGSGHGERHRFSRFVVILQPEQLLNVD